MALFFNRNDLDTVYYSVESEKVPVAFHKVKIALLTDLHSHSFGKGNQFLIREITKQSPDYVMMAGDMLVWNMKGFMASYHLITHLAKRYPVFYATGNHEKKASRNQKTQKTYQAYERALRENGVVFLNNHTMDVKRNGERIRISGLDVDIKYYKKIWEKVTMPVSYIERLLGRSEHECFHILLAHHPDYFPVYAKWGADLTLSGHVHGGIVILPWLGGVIAPSYEIFPKYDFGLFREGSKHMVLSKGLGSHTIPIRIRNRPELVVVELLSKNTKKNT